MSIHEYNSEDRRRIGMAVRRRLGFTLVEVMVTVALLAVVMGLLLYPMWGSFRYFRSATARADAQSAARIALDAMARELTEAMYVQLDMYDNSMIAFMLPLREDPADPNSNMLMPPRPDPTSAVRYWRALHDPTRNYNPGGHLAPGNPFFLARTVIPAPAYTDDAWNRWNTDWETGQNNAAVKSKTTWAAVSRVVHSDIDWNALNARAELRHVTVQPGFPYLEVQHKLRMGTIGERAAAREYRDYVVALTPNAVEYDASRLEFNPMAVSGEWLRPVQTLGEADHSVYQAQYPLWRRGTASTGWTALAEGYAVEFPDWARDPFLVIDGYRHNDGTGTIEEMIAIGMFDPDSRTMKVIDLADLRIAVGSGEDLNAIFPIYDTYYYPIRSVDTDRFWTAFGVDWIDGSVRFDFPPPETDTYMGEIYEIPDDWFVPSSAVEGTRADAPLPLWADRNTADAVLEAFLIPDTVQVWTNSVTGAMIPDLLLTRVSCTPRELSYQFQLGVEPSKGPGDPLGSGGETPNYGWIRLPETLADGGLSDDHTFWVDFRWHNNGVWHDAGDGGEYYWDLISAYYRTAAILDIGVTVTRADPNERLDRRIAQSANMTRRVKLHNLLRRVRYSEE